MAGAMVASEPCKGETNGCGDLTCDSFSGLKLFFLHLPRALPTFSLLNTKGVPSYSPGFANLRATLGNRRDGVFNPNGVASIQSVTARTLGMDTTPSALIGNRPRSQAARKASRTLGYKNQPPSGLQKMWEKSRAAPCSLPTF